MYLVTRADLSPAQQAVQAAHAAVELTAALARPVSSYDHQHLILLAAPGELSLYAVLRACEVLCLPHRAFYEPDLDHQLTAVAFTGEPPRAVRRLPLALQGDDREEHPARYA